MKSLVFDSGPLITFALNGILDIVPFLKRHYAGDFLICNAVRKEIIDTPSRSKRFAFESLQIGSLIVSEHLKLYDTASFSAETAMVTRLANSIYRARGRDITILNAGELDALVLAKNLTADAIVVDERTTRLLLENPFRLHTMLEKKFRTSVEVDKVTLKEFEKHFSTLRIIRSVDLALLAFEKGFFDDLINNSSREKVAESLLWALKLNGCAVSEREIKTYIKIFR